jgi:hypothetical protein
VADTVNEAFCEIRAVAFDGCALIAAPLLTVRVKLCVAALPIPLLACSVNVKGDPELLVGVPVMAPVVPSKDAQGGKVPLAMLKVGAGEPVAVTVKVPALFTENVVLLALVIAGACVTVSVKDWVATGATPLLA